MIAPFPLEIASPIPEFAPVADAKMVLLSGGTLRQSRNFGASYNKIFTDKPIRDVAVSGDGRIVAAVFYGNAQVPSKVFVSQDYGDTFPYSYTTSSSSLFISTVAVSNSGQYIVFCLSSGGVVVSSDYGVTWNLRAMTTKYSLDTCCSETGQYMLIAQSGGSALLSSNFGVSFSYVTQVGSRTFYSCGMSFSGAKMALGYYGSPGKLYLSSDYGVTWAPSTIPQHQANDWFSCVSFSPDGNLVVAKVSNQTKVSVNGGTSFYPGCYLSDWDIRVSGEGVLYGFKNAYTPGGLGYLLHKSVDFGVSAVKVFDTALYGSSMERFAINKFV